MAELPKQKKRVPLVGTTTTNYYGDKTHYLPVYKDESGEINVGLPEVNITPRNNLDLGVSVNRGRQAIFPLGAALVAGAAVPAIASTAGSVALPSMLKAMRSTGAKYSGATFSTPLLDNAMLMSGQLGSTGGGTASVAIPTASTIPNGVIPGAALGVGTAVSLLDQIARLKSTTIPRYLTESTDTTKTEAPSDSISTASNTSTTSLLDTIPNQGNSTKLPTLQPKKDSKWKKIKEGLSKRTKKVIPSTTTKKVLGGLGTAGAADVVRVSIMNLDPTRDALLFPSWAFDKVSYGLMSPEGRKIKDIDKKIEDEKNRLKVYEKELELKRLLTLLPVSKPVQTPVSTTIQNDTAKASPVNLTQSNDAILQKYLNDSF